MGMHKAHPGLEHHPELGVGDEGGYMGIENAYKSAARAAGAAEFGFRQITTLFPYLKRKMKRLRLAVFPSYPGGPNIPSLVSKAIDYCQASTQGHIA